MTVPSSFWPRLPPYTKSTCSIDIPPPRRAMAIGAHPDDIEFGCGATLAKWSAAGCHVIHVVCTDGSKGTWEADGNLAGLALRRQREQRAAAKLICPEGETVFLGWPDGELRAGTKERAQLCAWIRHYRPEVVLGHDPWRSYRLHPDHRNAGLLTLDSLVAARDPMFFPGHGGSHHRPSALLLWEAEEPNHIEDAGGYVELKISSLLMHKSQHLTTMGVLSDGDSTDFNLRVRALAEAAGRLVGLEAGEAFHLIDDL